MKKGDKSRAFSLIILICLTILSSCKSGGIYSAIEKIPDSKWNSHYKIVFETVIEDTISACDIELVIRTDSKYPFRNIFLFVTTTSPSGLNVIDTLEYYLSNEKGDWYGGGLGDIHDLSVPFKSNILFPEKGSYSFTITQGMRKKDLNGVLDIGLKISQIKSQSLGKE